MTTPLLDVLIIGGGPAGLAVASGLARQIYSAIVFDNGVYRNARATHMHNFAGWDHENPGKFRAKARNHLLEYYKTIQYEQAAVQTVRKTENDRFEAVDDQGRVWRGKKLVLANGATDVFPDIPGYEDCWGYGIYACLFCHGYEDLGVPSAGVLCSGHVGAPPAALHLSRMARRFTKKVTIYTNGADELSAQLKVELENDKGGQSGLVTVNSQVISKLTRGTQRESEVIVTLADGNQYTEGFLVSQPYSQVRGPFVQQLSLEVGPAGEIKTTQPFYETSMPGVFAVGDCATVMKSVSQGVAMGALAAGGLAFQLGAELAQAD